MNYPRTLSPQRGKAKMWKVKQVIFAGVIMALLLGGSASWFAAASAAAAATASGAATLTAQSAPYERVEEQGNGVRVYYLSCQQAQMLENTVRGVDAEVKAMRFFGNYSPLIKYFSWGFQLLYWIGFTNMTSDNVHRANYAHGYCGGVRVGEAKLWGVTVGLLVAPR